MKITFPCHGCGRKLKSRAGEVGRTRKCPVCATRVTCPEPVVEARYVAADLLEAEVVEAEVVPAALKASPATRRGAGAGNGAAAAAATPASEPRPAFNPFDDIDDDPYQLASPDPVEASATTDDPQRPCPMCGEMILASAVKCRFCGEVFDPKLKKGKSKKRRKSSRGGGVSLSGSRDVGIGLVCIVAGLGLTAFSYASAAGKGGGTYFIYHGLVICGVIQLFRGITGLGRSD
jgi:hypothetical protein